MSVTGVAKMTQAIAAQGRPVDALLANAGRGLGRGFLDQDLDEALKVPRSQTCIARWRNPAAVRQKNQNQSASVRIAL